MSITQHHCRALQFAASNLEAWVQVTENTSSLVLLTGNSNKVFLLSTTLPITPNQIIYRIFGPNEITDKNRERRIFTQLSHYNFGPKTLAVSSTERLEECFVDYSPTPNHMFHEHNFLQKFCKKLRKMHSLDMSQVLQNEGIMTDINVNKWRNLVIAKIELFENEGVGETIKKIISQEVLDDYNLLMPRESKVIYCHLDPSPLNCLYNSQKEKVKFVDFEFSGFSFRSLDFALALNESTMDYLYDQPPFFRVFEELAVTDELVKEYVIAYGEGKELWVEVKRSLIITNLVWSIWSLALYTGNKEGFDYSEYGLMRFRMFEKGLKEYKERGGVQYLQHIAEQLFKSNP